MTTHTLAVILGVLLVGDLGVALGMPRQKIVWTPERKVKTIVGIAVLVFAVWLVVTILF